MHLSHEQDLGDHCSLMPYNIQGVFATYGSKF